MYQKTRWQNHVTQYENRYREYENPDGTFTHEPIEGEVIQEGTPQNAHNFNNMEDGIFAANELGVEATRKLLQHERAINGVKGETGTVILTNSLVYPFNNSVATVSLAEKRDNTDYSVDIDAGADIRGNVGRIYVFDKLVNGFKIAFTGSAPSVAVKYVIRGGIA